MKYIKKVERININKPKVGDYVILHYPHSIIEDFNNFCSKNIGKIVEFKSDYCVSDRYAIQFDTSVPSIFFNSLRNLYTNCIRTHRGSIKYCSPNREELELIISTNKFNI